MPSIQDMMDKAARKVLACIEANDVEGRNAAGRKLWYLGLGHEVVHQVDGHVVVAGMNEVRTWGAGA